MKLSKSLTSGREESSIAPEFQDGVLLSGHYQALGMFRSDGAQGILLEWHISDRIAISLHPLLFHLRLEKRAVGRRSYDNCLLFPALVRAGFSFNKANVPGSGCMQKHGQPSMPQMYIIRVGDATARV